MGCSSDVLPEDARVDRAIFSKGSGAMGKGGFGSENNLGVGKYRSESYRCQTRSGMCKDLSLERGGLMTDLGRMLGRLSVAAIAPRAIRFNERKC